MTFTPDPKDGLRVKATSAEWLAIRAAKVDEQTCRVCYTARATEAAHLVPRSRKQEGDDVADNIVGLCLHCHDLVDAYDRAACSALRRALSRKELAYIVGRKGRGWLDQRFPWVASLPEGVDPPIRDLNPAPSESDETCPRCKGVGKVHKPIRSDVPTVARLRRTYSIAIPKDAQEDGADVLETLLESARDALREQMGWTATVPVYFVLSAVLADWVNSNVPVEEAA